MLEEDYKFYYRNLVSLKEFTLCGVTYAPFAPQGSDYWHLHNRPDIFWHLSTSSKERDCTEASPIVPCCNTLEMAGCSHIEHAQDVFEAINRMPCPYRAKAMRSLKVILDNLSKGLLYGISAAIAKDQKGRKKMIIRRRCGYLDYVCIFKVYPPKEQEQGLVTPLRLVTAFPLAYRSAIKKFDRIIDQCGLPIH